MPELLSIHRQRGTVSFVDGPTGEADRFQCSDMDVYLGMSTAIHHMYSCVYVDRCIVSNTVAKQRGMKTQSLKRVTWSSKELGIRPPLSTQSSKTEPAYPIMQDTS